MEEGKYEQTLVLIKPDALKNSLTGYVLSQLAEFHSGLRFAGARIVHVSRMLAEEHYIEHSGKPFYPALIQYLVGNVHYAGARWKRRVVAFAYQGPDAIQRIRDRCGPTNPHVARDTKPGCIRALGTVVTLKDEQGNVIGDRMDNLIHASANLADAEREIKLWFRPTDIPPAMRLYAAEACRDEFYFVKDGRLLTRFEEGSFCLVAPGDIVWASDLAVLRDLAAGRPTAASLAAVAAKYMVNSAEEP